MLRESWLACLPIRERLSYGADYGYRPVCGGPRRGRILQKWLVERTLTRASRSMHATHVTIDESLLTARRRDVSFFRAAEQFEPHSELFTHAFGAVSLHVQPAAF